MGGQAIIARMDVLLAALKTMETSIIRAQEPHGVSLVAVMAVSLQLIRPMEITFMVNMSI